MNINRRNSLIDLNHFFNGYYQPSTATKNLSRASTNQHSPKVDVYESDDSYELIAELAGISKENINVTVNDSILTIEAKANTQQETEGNENPSRKLLRKERFIGDFSRSFNLGQDINQEEIKAVFNNGLLSLTVPKVQEVVPQARKIDIH